MSPITLLAWIGFGLAALPAGLLLINLLLFRRPRRTPQAELPAVSVLIPARDEEAHIGGAVDAALASQGVEVEVLVLDDHSADRTADTVQQRADDDPRVRLLQAPALPAGWAGKQHACHVLAGHATSPLILFVDADVRLTPDAVARAASFMEAKECDLASGFPRQITGSWAERLVIPLIHFVLLGYLPMPGMRWTNHVGFAAGCGQLFMARRSSYQSMGGHAAIRATFHDGIQLPRAFRRAGLRTDLFDATDLASCRMYTDARQVLFGLAKNAHEGMAGSTAIWVWSILLLVGHVLPAGLALVGLLLAPTALWTQLSLMAMALGLIARLVLAWRFHQSWIGAVLHPVGVAGLMAIQWFAWWRRRRGQAVPWKGRVVTH